MKPSARNSTQSIRLVRSFIAASSHALAYADRPTGGQNMGPRRLRHVIRNPSDLWTVAWILTARALYRVLSHHHADRGQDMTTSDPEIRLDDGLVARLAALEARVPT